MSYATKPAHCVAAATPVAPRSLLRWVPHWRRPGWSRWTWAFVLTTVDEGSCRLVVRVCADYRPRWLLPLLPFLLEPAHFIMERKMLKTIEQRARRGSAP